MMNKKTIIITASIVILLVAVFGWATWQDSQRSGKLQVLADCINKSGAKFYGAFWCPHCQDQKAMFQTLFGNADKSLPYIECSTPDSNGQLQVCKDAGIKVYPTWKFASGTHEGSLTLQELAEKTQCPAL